VVCCVVMLEIGRGRNRIADAASSTGSSRSSREGGRLERWTFKSNMITLYVKTHRDTGLKYFGKTMKDDPISYKGSGKYWLNHLKKHGSNFDTEIIGVYELEEEAMEIALKFSKENNIVESDEWANLREENALDGHPKGIVFTDEWRQNMSKRRKGVLRGPHTQERRENIRKAKLGVPNLKLKGIPKSKEHVENHAKSVSKEWLLTDKDGNEKVILNLRKFCRENDLDRRSMLRVLSGEYSHHRGWKVKRHGQVSRRTEEKQVPNKRETSQATFRNRHAP